MKRHVFFLYAGTVLALFCWAFVSVHGEVVYPNQYYTWGVSNDRLVIADGKIITEAFLTVHGITAQGDSKNDILYIHLLDDIPAGFIANDENVSGDNFANEGVLMEPVYHDLAEGKEDLTYALSELNDESSYVWQIFDYPFNFELADWSIVSYSSALLTIIDYTGIGTGFGFGFDPNGFNGFEFDGLSLSISIESFEGQPEQSVQTFTYGNTNRPPVLEAINDKSVDEKTELIFSISASDADGDAIIYSVQSLPEGADFAGETFVWTPTYAQAGTYEVTFTASDGQDTDWETIAITVKNIPSKRKKPKKGNPHL